MNNTRATRNSVARIKDQHHGVADQQQRYRIVLPSGMYQQIRGFLFTGPRQERLGVILAGISRVGNEIRLLGREFIPATGAAIDFASGSRVVGSSRYSQQLMQRCAKTGETQVDCHSHPFGANNGLWFSSVDDRCETEMAAYIYRHLPETFYASLVFDEAGERGRVWLPGDPPHWHAMESIRLLETPLRELSLRRLNRREKTPEWVRDEAFDRQIQSFGEEGQARMRAASVTVVGAGGTGSIVIEGLARLGIGGINIVEPDSAEMTNLNRVIGMRLHDAARRVPKSQIAARSVREINPRIRVETYSLSVFNPLVLPVLKEADLVVVATDNQSSRLYCQHVAAQHLVPLMHLGVNLEAEQNQLTDISGEYALSLPGPAGWCLKCARVIDVHQAGWELASAIDKARWVKRGYARGAHIPAPSVRHLNGVVADLALAEIHNFFSPYREPRTYVAYDGLKCELTPISIGRDQRCALCSHDAVLGLGDLEPPPDFTEKRLVSVPRPAPSADDGKRCREDVESSNSTTEIAGYLTYMQNR